MNTQTKSSYEKYPIGFNFVRELKLVGETVTGKTVTCVNIDTGVSSKTTVISSEAISSPKIILVVDAGSTGETHRIKVTATTSGGNTYTKYLILFIASNITDNFQKIPTSEFLISNEFDDLESSDSLSSKTIAVTSTSDGADATSTIIESSLIEGDKVLLGVMGGVAGTDYRIIIKVVTTLGYKYQKDILLEVRNEAQI